MNLGEELKKHWKALENQLKGIPQKDIIVLDKIEQARKRLINRISPYKDRLIIKEIINEELGIYPLQEEKKNVEGKKEVLKNL